MPAKKLKVIKVSKKTDDVPRLPAIASSDKDKKLYQLKTPFKKAICGDLFGTTSTGSMLGMLYRARVQNNSKEKQMLEKKLETVDGNFLNIILISKF